MNFDSKLCKSGATSDLTPLVKMNF